MSKRTPDFIIQQMAEGTIAERNAMKNEIDYVVENMIKEMPTNPTDRLMYIRNLVEQVKANKLNMETFKTFIKLTNSWNELDKYSLLT